jgi:hypothetical protein
VDRDRRATRTREPAKARPRRRALWLVLALLAAGTLAAVATFARLTPSTPAGGAPFPFPCLSFEGAQQHIHPYLRIYLDGQPVTIPAYVGIRDGDQACFEPVHTHDASGVVHIESTSATQTYTLGDFFAIWRATYGTASVKGVDLPLVYTAGELLGRKADATHAVRLLVDGRPSSAGPALVLNRLDFCTAATTNPPCYPTAVGDPYPPSVASQYGTGHTIVLEYVATGAR